MNYVVGFLLLVHGGNEFINLQFNNLLELQHSNNTILWATMKIF